MKHRFSAALSALILTTVTGVGNAHAAVARHNGRIAYSIGAILPQFDPAAGSQVFTVNPDGSNVRQLTHLTAPAQAGDPAYSPDGRRILYVSNQGGPFQIRIMNSDGSRQRRLVADPGHDAFVPRWSPDGRHIVFTRCTAPFGFVECTIATVNSDGSGVRDLTGGHWVDFSADYSPDGRTIAFSSDRGGFLSAVWTVRPGTPGLHRLTKPNLEAFWPDYAPVANRLLVTSNFGRPISDVYTLNPDGTSLKRLTHFTGGRSGDFARYSPDGRKIVLHSSRGLATMNSDGSGLTTLVPVGDLVIADWGPAR